MAIDPNILLQARQPQLNDPLEVAGKAMSLKQLQIQNQAMQRDQSDKMAYNDILKRNTSVGSDGKLAVNKGATLSELSKTNPQAAMSLQEKWASEDFDQVKKRTEMSKQLAWSMTPENYSVIRNQAIQMGIPHADKLPDFYDPGIVRQLQMSTLNADEQLKQMNSDRDYKLKSREVAVKEREAGGMGGAPGKMTEAQSKALGYGRRAMISDQMLGKIMSDPSADVTSLATQIRSDLPKWLGGAKTPQEQALNVAKLGFISAVLRKESGAAVTPAEFESYNITYFPQPGDSPQVLADKQQLRANFIDTEKMAAGNAWRDPIESKSQPKTNAQASTQKIFKTSEIEW